MRSAMAGDEWQELFTPLKLGQHSVPGLWRYMMPEDALYFRVDPESKSTCFDCPKVKAAGFHPDVRCCTVIPRVPNFLLGLALLAGNTPVNEALDDGMLLPEGLIISPRDLRSSLNFISAPNKGLPEVVCPFLDQKSKACGIYAYRNSVCSTFFCSQDRGASSEAFWTAFGDLGTQIETSLSQWALAEVGFDLDGYFRTLDDLNTLEHWSEDDRRQLYGPWFGQERKLFEATARVVALNKHQLFSLASQFQPRQAKVYDARLRTHFQTRYNAELVAEALPLGEPESIASLWYTLQLTYRNLQLSPKA
jgi:Fe-S-cluster containining protein